jgi:fatty acid amide hydrolase 2
VNNPHDSRRISGGSSAGEGVLISSAGSLMGIGNDIGGSVRVPSSMNGIFGLKPTNYPGHTVPVEGIVPDFCSYKPGCDMLSNGPLVRYASDLPTVLAVQAGQPVNYYKRNVNYTNGFKLYYLEDIDILICEKLHDEQRDQVRKVSEAQANWLINVPFSPVQVKHYFEQTYNLTVQKVSFPLMNRLFELFQMNSWSPTFIQPSDIIPQFMGIYNDVSNNTFLDWEFHIQKNFSAPKTEAERAFLQAKLDKFRVQVNQLLGQDGLLLLPMLQTPVPYHHMEPFQSFNLPYAMVSLPLILSSSDHFPSKKTWNLLGNPALAAPTGKSPATNMPVGVQFVASNFNEALLVSVAQEMETAFGGWVQPGL